MPHTDPISDMFTRIRNAINVTHESVDIPASKLKISIAQVLKSEGYINSYEVIEESKINKILRISLKYGPRGERLITGIQKVSTPGLRVYSNAKYVPRVLDGLGISIISTSRGLMTDRQARKQNVGGEVVCKIW